MLYPTINELTRDEYNRYELALATAKCARLITDEYVRQREAAEKAATGNKDTDRNLINMITKEYRDEKAVKNAITKIHSGEYRIVRGPIEDYLPATEETAEVDEAVEAAEVVADAEAEAAEAETAEAEITEETTEEVVEESAETATDAE